MSTWQVKIAVEEVKELNILGTMSDSAECYARLSVYVLGHLLPVCNLLVQGPKMTYNWLLFIKTVLNFTVVFYVEFCSF